MRYIDRAKLCLVLMAGALSVAVTPSVAADTVEYFGDGFAAPRHLSVPVSALFLTSDTFDMQNIDLGDVMVMAEGGQYTIPESPTQAVAMSGGIRIKSRPPRRGLFRVTNRPARATFYSSLLMYPTEEMVELVSEHGQKIYFEPSLDYHQFFTGGVDPDGFEELPIGGRVTIPPETQGGTFRGVLRFTLVY